MWCSVGDHAEMKIQKDQFEHFSPNLKWLHLGQNCPECTLNSYSRIRGGGGRKHKKGRWRKKKLKYLPYSPDKIFG